MNQTDNNRVDLTKLELPNGTPCLFKLYDFTTEMVGRWDSEEKEFYVERADGTRYRYSFGVVWFKILIMLS